ncbi:ATP-binding protein [Actinomadura rubrisoli]|uniref:ATP-binding protein n=1 Tax=Actinomadura rubrisoli TaxID=2530368 RepID=A0A4V2YWV0_9ACTN|nr:ATP-binding protein [Actinomadura rubrisoli]TDD86417.1 ATP-binding protein [Actinomadura rubrisoli]
MIILPTEKASAKKARDHVAKIADAEDWPVDIDDLRLVTSELVTNAITHTKTGDTIMVCAYSRGGVYCVEVWDSDETLPVSRFTGASLVPNGRGLGVVGKLATRWSAARSDNPEGKVVCAEWVAA